jgi:DNA-binding transcriptional regulator YiaG
MNLVPGDYLHYIMLPAFVEDWKRLGLNENDLKSLEIMFLAEPTPHRQIKGIDDLYKFIYVPKKNISVRVYFAKIEQKTIVFLSAVSRKKVAGLSIADRMRLKRTLTALKTAIEKPKGKSELNIVRPPSFSPEDIVTLRAEMGVSQAVFADLVGVSLVLVQSWESGVRVPSVLACRLFEIAGRDPKKFINEFSESAGHHSKDKIGQKSGV